MMVMERETRIEAYQARAMLRAMGYGCDGLDCVADIPLSVLQALQSTWEQARLGELHPWEIDLVFNRICEAAGLSLSGFLCARGHEMIPKGKRHDRDDEHDQETQEAEGTQAFPG